MIVCMKWVTQILISMMTLAVAAAPALAQTMGNPPSKSKAWPIGIAVVLVIGVCVATIRGSGRTHQD